MSEWNTGIIGDIAVLSNGRTRPKTEIGAVAVYGGNGILGYTETSNSDGETVIIGRVGAYCGSVYYSDKEIWVSDNAIKVKAPTKISPKFLYYFLKNYNLNNHAEGSSHPLLTQGLINGLEAYYPTSYNEQQAIAGVLSSLDDKIDLLHRNNKTLEAMAETLFRQWFVEEASESWTEGVVNDLFTLHRGYDLPVQDRKVGNIPIITSGGIGQFHNNHKIKGPGVVTGRSGMIGNVFYVRKDFWPLNTTLYISEYKRSKPIHAYFFLKTLDLSSLNAGSAVPTLNRNHVHILPTKLPPVELVEKFEIITTDLFIKRDSNSEQIDNLQKLRDTLLPKLMSGEVRVNQN